MRKGYVAKVVVLASCACILAGLISWDGLPRWLRIVLGAVSVVVMLADLFIPFSLTVDDDKGGK